MSTQFNSLVCWALHNTQALALHKHVPHHAAEAIKPYPYSLSLCALWPGRKLFCHMHYKHVCHTLPTICMHLCCFLAAECICTHHWLLQNVKQLQTACLQTLDAMQHDHMREPSIQRRMIVFACLQGCKLTSRTPRTPASSTVSLAAAASTVSSASQPPC